MFLRSEFGKSCALFLVVSLDFFNIVKDEINFNCVCSEKIKIRFYIKILMEGDGIFPPSRFQGT